MAIDEQEIYELIRSFEDEIEFSEGPTETLFDVIERPTRERYWQKLLAYFLNPSRGHGFGSEILSAFLQTIEEQTAISGLDGPTDSIFLDVEVKTSTNKRVDLLLSQAGSWFLCIELKVGASEHSQQTVDYVESTHIGGRNKSNYPADGHHYLYIAADQADRPSAREFESLTWEPIESAWRKVLNNQRTDTGAYPTRGVAQFAEFLEMIRSEMGDPEEGLQSYYRDIQRAKKAYEDLVLPYTVALERGVREKVQNPGDVRIRRKPGANYPRFDHDTSNRIEIDKEGWQVGRNKPTIVFELNFHIRPHRGPNSTKHRPSVAVYLDIRGGTKLKQELRSSFKKRVPDDRYRPYGFGEPYESTKWHFLHKEVLIDDSKTPIQDVLDSFEVLAKLETELDSIAREVSK